MVPGFGQGPRTADRPVHDHEDFNHRDVLHQQMPGG